MLVSIASDVALYREALAEALRARDDFAPALLAPSALHAWKILRQESVDVMILDAGLPGALDLAKQVFDSALECKVIVIGLGEIASDVPKWASAGISGFVTRESHLSDLLRTIHEVFEDRWRTPPAATTALLSHVARVSRTLPPPASSNSLTAREREVVEFLARGCSNKEIARELSIAIPTVKNHVCNILSKLNLRRRGQAAAWLQRQSSLRVRAS